MEQLTAPQITRESLDEQVIARHKATTRTRRVRKARKNNFIPFILNPVNHFYQQLQSIALRFSDTYTDQILDVCDNNIVAQETYSNNNVINKLHLRDNKPSHQQTFRKSMDAQGSISNKLVTVTKFNHAQNTLDIINIDHLHYPLVFKKTTLDMTTRKTLSKSVHTGMLINNMPFVFNERDSAEKTKDLIISPL